MTKIALHELQIIDSQISKLEQTRSSLEEKAILDGAIAELERLDKVRTEQATRLKLLESEQKAAEDAVKLISDKMAREESRLYGGSVTNPKELKGLEDELASLNRRRDQEETVLLEKIELVEELSGKQSAVDEKLQAVRADADLALSEFEKVSADIDAQMSSLRSERDEALGPVSPETLRLYDKLRHEKQGLAVVQLDGATCGGCHMELPAKELEGFTAQEQMWRCPNCRRILIK